MSAGALALRGPLQNGMIRFVNLSLFLNLDDLGRLGERKRKVTRLADEYSLPEWSSWFLRAVHQIRFDPFEKHLSC